MATIESLKRVLRQSAAKSASASTQKLSDTQYSAGFDVLLQGPGQTAYQDFIVPQLSQVLEHLLTSRQHISVLEIGPGPESVLSHLPSRLRRAVERYTAFEPNDLYALRMDEALKGTNGLEAPLPCPGLVLDVQRQPFSLQHAACGDMRFDLVLFCHSMYGMNPKHAFVKTALELISPGGMVVVFHRDATLGFDGLVACRTASFPTGVVRVADNDEDLDSFTRFVAGFTMQDEEADELVRDEWRKMCRTLGRSDEEAPGYLWFSAPDAMLAFDHRAFSLSELMAQVPLAMGKTIKNREARLHYPASIVRPTEVQHIQHCIQWALKHEVGLTVIGGGHSAHCLHPNVVAVDMGAFDKVHVLPAEHDGDNLIPLVVAEAGCQTGEIIRKAMEMNLTVPLGSRPSVGAGLWLQGGLGHLARLHGLACDAIVGAVVVSVDSSQVHYVGNVPLQHRPRNAVRAENETDLLWALKGAGTNFGIVVSVTFKAYPAPTYMTRHWSIPLNDNLEAEFALGEFDQRVARKVARNASADAYLYWDAGQLQLGVATIECSMAVPLAVSASPSPSSLVSAIWGPENGSKVVDGIGLFDTEMYVSSMHGGHGGGKTSSFKRCLFLKDVGNAPVTDLLVSAIKGSPSPLCYLHMLQGGGAVRDIAPGATAFGHRDWDFACVVTGVWPRNQDGTETAQAAVQWVYNVATNLLPFSSGVYSADLGPDPRDTALAAAAFGQNILRLARLKQTFDPQNVLSYACPLACAPTAKKLIVLVTGDSCAGKDYCANIWVSDLKNRNVMARAVSISDSTKREYAAAAGADLDRLLHDRGYKEIHRPALTAFFQKQVLHRPQLPEEHFLDVVQGAMDVEVLLVTGMRDDAPVAAFSHLVPDSRVIEVHVTGDPTVRAQLHDSDKDSDTSTNVTISSFKSLLHHPDFIFHNITAGPSSIRAFSHTLLQFLSPSLQSLHKMVQIIPSHPCPGIDFRDVLSIAQQPGGLSLCTSLLRSHLELNNTSFQGTIPAPDIIVSCEVGGIVFAAPFAAELSIPLVLIRAHGKLPPPTIGVRKPRSHISSATCGSSLVTDSDLRAQIEMPHGALPRGADTSVLVVDDVLASGETMCAVLQLLERAGASLANVRVVVVGEFPVHRGRDMLRQRGFGVVKVGSLLLFGGA